MFMYAFSKNDEDELKTIKEFSSNNLLEGLCLLSVREEDKTIKYLNWRGYPINAVGDPVSCEVRRTIEGGGKVTGPIKPGTTYGYGKYWDCLWYNYSAKKLVLTEINIEYMDGSSIHINKNELKYVR